MYDVRQLIDNGWGAPAEEFVVVSPYDGTPVSRAPVASPADVATAVKAARAAAPSWAATARGPGPKPCTGWPTRSSARPTAWPGSCPRRWASRWGGSLDSVRAGVGTLRQYAELGPLHGGRTLAGNDDAIDLMVYQPRGVVAVITPWNDPVAVSCGLLGAALVVGNTVVYKPSERTPATGWALTELLATQLPDRVLSLVPGGGPVGAALAAADVDVVAHVGATATGRSIAATCATTGAKALLENGGKDPLIVDADVDPVWAAQQAATGAFANRGQICVAVERIYVHPAGRRSKRFELRAWPRTTKEPWP